MIKLHYKDYNGEIVYMTCKEFSLEHRLEIFKRFLNAIDGASIQLDSELVELKKDEMVWTDEEIFRLKAEVIEEYLETVKEDINNELPRDANNYMEEAPF